MRRIKIGTLSKRLRTNPKNYRYWASEDLLDPVDRRGCTEGQAVEYAILVALTESMSLQAVREFWSELRGATRGRVIAGDLYVVQDIEAGQAQLAFEAADVLQLVRHGRPVRVVPIADRVETARRAVRVPRSRSPKEGPRDAADHVRSTS
jgi:hypothetical protein